MADNRTLHLYAQPYSHEGAWVVGNKQGLRALRDAIDAALASGKLEGTTEYATDGEGYKVFVLPLEDMSQLMLPYTDPTFNWKGLHPYETAKGEYVTVATRPEEP